MYILRTDYLLSFGDKLGGDFLMLKMPKILTVMVGRKKDGVLLEILGTRIQTWEVQDGLFASEE